MYRSKNEELGKLPVLPVNKTVVFYSPIEGKDVLVRTGTIPDASCVYHSLLHAYSKDYISMDEQGRKKLVSRLRNSLSDKVDRERWENSGLVAKIPFQESVNSLLAEVYGKGKNQKISKLLEGEHKDTYSLILEMVTLADFEKRILPQTYDNSGDDPIRVCKEKLVKNTEDFYTKVFESLTARGRNQIDEKRVKFCVKKLKELLLTVCDEAEDYAFEDYISNMKNTTVEMDEYTIGLVSSRLNRDIFFLDTRSRMPFSEGKPTHVKKRKSIILLWTGGAHYEVVGRLLPGNKVQREFEGDDPLITRIRTFVCKPEKVASEYPNLIPYLSKEHRKNIGLKDDSDREENDDEKNEKNESDDYGEKKKKGRKDAKKKKEKSDNKVETSEESEESEESSSETDDESESSEESSESRVSRRKKKEKKGHSRSSSSKSSNERRDARTWLGHSSPKKEKTAKLKKKSSRSPSPGSPKKSPSPKREPVKESKREPVKESRKEKT